jgi:outer membrane receptor protein involved in Fe transport
MNCKQRLACAIAAILGQSGVHAQGSATSLGTDSATEIPEIIVTAQRREESTQNVPITIQALTGETLSQLNVQTFDDFMKFLPNISASGTGPGQSSIYMRGLSTGQTVVQGSGGQGSFPNVAVYLDEQAVQLPGRNLDIYSADLERIEVLEGPQGTLFGAGAQAGVIRYITNKPKLDSTEANVDAGYAVTAHGDPSSNATGVLNLPIIPGTLAVRGVIYNDSRGGYIDNIPGTFVRSSADKGIVNYFGGAVPPNSGPISNASLVGNAINPLQYQGLRVSGLWNVNDDWNVLLSQSYQSMDAQGVFWDEAYDGLGQPLPRHSVQLYNPSYDKDKFDDTQLTINGHIGQLKMIYTGAYLDRNVDQQQDYTNYSRGHYADYYQCAYPGYPFKGGAPTTNSAGYCWSPSAYWLDRQNSTHESHELRVITPDEWRLRAIAGIFWEDYKIHENTDWFYRSNPNFQDIAPPPGSTANDASIRPQSENYFVDITRGYEQKAAFTSLDFDLIPKKLTVTAGTRYYDIRNFTQGSYVGSFGCEIGGPYSGGVPPNPCTAPVANGSNLSALNLNKSYVGFRSRANLSWHITDDILVYYTWSQGFRPGGFNVSQPVISPSSPIYGIYTPPIGFAPDTLINNELGWKTEWLGHRLQLNGAAYQEDWKSTQLSVFDPGVTGNQPFSTNGPNYRVRGVEASAVARVTHGLTLTASASVNTGEVVKAISLIDPKSGQPIAIANPFGAIGSPLANSPPFQASIRLRDEIAIGDYRAFWQLGAEHRGGSYATADRLTTTLQGVSVAFYDPSFTTYDASIGVAKDSWAVSVYGENLCDTLGTLYSSYAEYVKMDSITRPRTLGLRFSYKFIDRK